MTTSFSFLIGLGVEVTDAAVENDTSEVHNKKSFNNGSSNFISIPSKKTWNMQEN